MHLLAEVSPQAFTSSAEGWITAISTVALAAVSALAVIVIRLCPIITEIKARLERHSAVDASLNDGLRQLALAVPPPAGAVAALPALAQSNFAQLTAGLTAAAASPVSPPASQPQPTQPKAAI